MPDLPTNIIVRLVNEVTAPLRVLTNDFAALKLAGTQASSAFDFSMKVNQSVEGLRRVSGWLKNVTAEPLKLAETSEVAFLALRRSTGLTGVAFERVKEQVSGLGAGTEFTTAELAGGMTAMANNGLDAARSVNELQHIMSLAVAAHLPLAQATTMTTEIMKKFGATATETAHYTDVLAQAAMIAPKAGIAGLGAALDTVAGPAKRFGMSFETTSALLTSFAKSSGSAEKAGSALDTVFAHLSSPRTSKLVGLGLETVFGPGVDVKSKLADIPKLLQDVTEKTSGLSAISRSRVFSAIFGAPELSSMVKIAGPDGLGAVIAALKGATGATDKLKELEESTATAAHIKYEKATERLSEAIGASLVPGAKRWDEALAIIIDRVTGFVKKHESLISTIVVAAKWIGVFAGVIAGLAAVLGAAATISGVISLAAGIWTLVPAVMAVMAPLLPFIVALGAVAAAVYEIYTNWEDLKKSLSDVGTLKDMVNILNPFSNAADREAAMEAAANERTRANQKAGIGMSVPFIGPPSPTRPPLVPNVPLPTPGSEVSTLGPPASITRPTGGLSRVAEGMLGKLGISIHVDSEGKASVTKVRQEGSIPLNLDTGFVMGTP